MNKLTKNGFAVLMTITSLVSCTREPLETITEPTNEPKVVTTNFTARTPETRTVFGAKDNEGYPVLWTSGEVKIMLSYLDADSQHKSHDKQADVTVLNNGLEASFSASFSQEAGQSAFQYYAISPLSSLFSFAPSNNNVNYIIPTSQKPLESSVDESAQILIAKDAGTYNTLQTNIDFTFNHAVAYAKMTLKNLTIPNGATVIDYELTASSDIAGQWTFKNDGSVAVKSGAKTISINPSNMTNGVVWFALAPTDLRGGTLTITINTSDGPILKTISFPANGNAGNFQLGHVSQFSVNMEGLTPSENVVYTLVTDSSELTIGSEVVIAANGNQGWALSTTQAENNRPRTEVTKSDDNLRIENPSNAVQLFTIVEGYSNGTIAFSFMDGNTRKYIYAASSTKNWLRTTTDLNGNSSWIVAITNKEATITAQGSNTRKILQYNNGDKIFSCYASGQQPVYIYKKYTGTTATFSLSDFSGQGQSGTGGSLTATHSPITVSSNKGYCSGSEHVRLYETGTLTICAGEGKIIKKVELTSTNSGDGEYGPSKLSNESGCGIYSVSGNVGTWTAAIDTGSQTSTVTLNATAQFRFTQIKVTYQ